MHGKNVKDGTTDGKLVLMRSGDSKLNGNPQLEGGYARTANEILEALARTPMTDHENRCVHFLFRKTYG
jgi:D-alanyl-D-alanine carboxypeptidase